MRACVWMFVYGAWGGLMLLIAGRVVAQQTAPPANHSAAPPWATDTLGTVAAGKLADLVLLDADPLTDIWNTTRIRAVVANGHYYDRATLDRLLATAEQEAVRARAASERRGSP